MPDDELIPIAESVPSTFSDLPVPDDPDALTETDRAMMRVLMHVTLMSPAERAKWEKQNVFRYENEFGTFLFVRNQPAKLACYPLT